MTKNIFIVAIAVLLSVAFCSLSAQNVSKDYNVDEFSAINLQSVGNIIFTQSAGCSCRLEGPSEFVEKTRVTVKNGTLVISYKDRNARNIKNLICYITAPFIVWNTVLRDTDRFNFRMTGQTSGYFP